MRTLATFAILAVLNLALLPTASAASQGSTVSLRVANMSVEDFVAFHQRLAGDLKSHKYDYVSNGNRDQIAAAQTAIRKLLNGKRSMRELDEPQRVAVFNAHEQVVAILNDAELDRVVCTRQHQLGSHRPKLECRTQRDRGAIAQRQKLENLRTRNCGSGEACTGG